MHPDAARVGLSLCEVPIALGVGVAVFEGVYWLGCSYSHCVDVSGLPWLVAGVIAGLTFAACFWLAMRRRGPPFRRRLIWDGIALATGIASYLVPITLAHLAEARSNQAAKDAAGLRERQRAEWVESLKAHAHGAPGDVPAMLVVEDEGFFVAVTNIAPTAKTVALAKVVPDATAAGGWNGCAMYVGKDQGYYHYSIGPRQTVRYRLDSTCAGAFAGALIEYRVGDGPGDEGWWSDSAFAAPEGRFRGMGAPSLPPDVAPVPNVAGGRP